MRYSVVQRWRVPLPHDSRNEPEDGAGVLAHDAVVDDGALKFAGAEPLGHAARIRQSRPFGYNRYYMIERGSEMAKAYDHTQVEAPLYQMWMDRATSSREGGPRRAEGQALLHHHAAAQRHRRAAPRPRPDGDRRGHPHPLAPHAGRPHALAARRRPRRHRHAERRREGAGQGGPDPPRPRPRGVRRARLGVGRARSAASISRQHMRLGVSCDWARERFTLDDGPQRAVRATFERLFDEGLIYRGERIINWCPRCQTALSDLEVEHEEAQGHLWYVRYPLVDDAGNVDRRVHHRARPRAPRRSSPTPAIAVNPDDERWKPYHRPHGAAPDHRAPDPDHRRRRRRRGVRHRRGQGHARPRPDRLRDRRSGTTCRSSSRWTRDAHDERRRRPVRRPGPLRGARAHRRRPRSASGLLEKVEPYTHSVGHCERCDTIVEPLVSEQWFVKTASRSLSRRSTSSSDGEIEIVPERFEQRLHATGWRTSATGASRASSGGATASRSGTATACGTMIAAVEDPTKCPRAAATQDIEQDPDVLDTWFSSGLWPFSTLGWPEETRGPASTSTRRPSWRPATTSSSSGSRA